MKAVWVKGFRDDGPFRVFGFRGVRVYGFKSLKVVGVLGFRKRLEDSPGPWASRGVIGGVFNELVSSMRLLGPSSVAVSLCRRALAFMFYLLSFVLNILS